jgi:hypothetical protein
MAGALDVGQVDLVFRSDPADERGGFARCMSYWRIIRKR